MSDDRGQSTATEIDWPPTLRAELEGIQAPRRPWYITVGPAYLTIFVWAPFLDPLWRNDLAGGRLGPLAVTAIVAALACFGLFYYPAAMWGYRTGRRLGVVAASTFGTTGSEWLTGVALAVAELVWYAVAIDYAVDSTFSGLAACGLVPASILAPWHAGPFALRGPIFLCTAMFWIFITVMAGLLRLSGVIAALMKVYSPVALGLLTISAIWAMPGLAAFQPDEVRAVAPVGQSQPSYSTIPLVTGFFSLVGLMGVEWGAASARRRDVVFGGLAGILVAGSWTAVMSLIVVAGAVGRLLVARPAAGVSVPDLPQLSFRWGIMHGVGGVPAGAILILFGLAALAPACYSSFLFIRKLFARWPRVRRVNWAWIGGTVALVLVATTWPGRLEAVDYVMGVVFAPAVGAIAGDFMVQRGQWAGVRRGIHPPGAIAWVLGVAIRPLLDVLAARGRLPIAPLISSPIAGFLIAASAYWLFSGMGRYQPATAVETFPAGSGEVVAMVVPATSGGSSEPASP